MSKKNLFIVITAILGVIIIIPLISAAIFTNNTSNTSNSSTSSSTNNQSNVSTSNDSNSMSSGSGDSNNMTTISKAELAEKNGENNCWVAYNKVVYNVSSYLSQHPGGKEAILRKCGTNLDSLSDLHQGGPFDSNKIQEILKPLIVANLTD
jgi:cytochrome b involved in lipid metabolism